MLDVQTHSKLMDSVSQMLNCRYNDADHIIISTLLLLLTYTLTQIQKMQTCLCIFVY